VDVAYWDYYKGVWILYDGSPIEPRTPLPSLPNPDSLAAKLLSHRRFKLQRTCETVLQTTAGFLSNATQQYSFSLLKLLEPKIREPVE